METNNSSAEAMDTKMLESKFKQDLNAMKTVIDSLKNDVKFVEEAKDDLVALKKDFEAALKIPEGKAAQEQASMRKIVESVASSSSTTFEPECSSTTSETKTKEWHDFKKEMAVFEKLKRKEIEGLKLSLESELRASEGKKMEEVNALRSALSVIDLSSLQNMSYSELSALKREIEDRKAQSLRKVKIFKDAMPTEHVHRREARLRKALSLLRSRKRNFGDSKKPPKDEEFKDSLKLDTDPLLSSSVQKRSIQRSAKKIASSVSQDKMNLKKNVSFRKSSGKKKFIAERQPTESASRNQIIKAGATAQSVEYDSTDDPANLVATNHHVQNSATEQSVNPSATEQSAKASATEQAEQSESSTFYSDSDSTDSTSVAKEQSVNPIVGEQPINSSLMEHWVQSINSSVMKHLDKSSVTEQTEQLVKSSSSEQCLADSTLRKTTLPSSKRSSFNRAQNLTTQIAPGREADTSLIECLLLDAEEEPEQEVAEKENTMPSASPESSFFSNAESSSFFSDSDASDSLDAMTFIADQVFDMTGGNYLLYLDGCYDDTRISASDDSINISQSTILPEDVNLSHSSHSFLDWTTVVSDDELTFEQALI